MYIKLYREIKRACEKFDIDTRELDKSCDDLIINYKKGLENDKPRKTSAEIFKEEADLFSNLLV